MQVACGVLAIHEEAISHLLDGRPLHPDTSDGLRGEGGTYTCTVTARKIFPPRGAREGAPFIHWSTSFVQSLHTGTGAS